jgi:nicotinamide riboside kinase
MKQQQPKIYVITGAESTGKSDLTKWLAAYFNVPYIPEFARSHIENLNRKYDYDDVEYIAKKQVEQINAYKNSGYPFIFVDTWLIITMIWFEFVFSKKPSWIETEILNTQIEMFLVCNIDLPWEPDPVRENGGKSRVILHNKYIDTIKKYHFNYKIVNGRDSERYRSALYHMGIHDKEITNN